MAGVQEAKDELVEIVEFYALPRSSNAWWKIPKGACRPFRYVDKMARAVAGEAKVPFFSINGSEFVEMFVGVGASRVRDLFAKAQSIARALSSSTNWTRSAKRGANPLVGHDEREQTLNQLLVEMDGFDSRRGVIIPAATNRPEILDSAPATGSVDRQVLVDRLWDLNEEAILRLHAQHVRLSPRVDLHHRPAHAGIRRADSRMW